MRNKKSHLPAFSEGSGKKSLRFSHENKVIEIEKKQEAFPCYSIRTAEKSAIQGRKVSNDTVPVG